ncbi:MAG: DUF1919 domain-containing protein [Dorea sp.]|nr:DUF1919 domain-containing protein [Dorea sp.]
MLLRDKIRDLEWAAYKQKRVKKLKNNDFSIISSNCIGMFMYKDMELPYLSPTINLSIPMNDFVKMAENLRWYMEQKITQAETKEDYPVGFLGDVEIRFIHYSTFEEAVWKWEERKKRINWDNLFIAGAERDGCTYETIRRFQQLPYKNKVIFTHVRYPEFPSAYYIKGFEEEKEVGVITFFKEQFFKRRYLDDFDYVRFLNGSDVC